jgi:hypothetical protein
MSGGEGDGGEGKCWRGWSLLEETVREGRGVRMGGERKWERNERGRLRGRM